MELEEKKDKKTKKLIAKKDWILFCNDVHEVIKKDDDINKLKLDKKLIKALKKEKVL
jgi:hypothetical protein